MLRYELNIRDYIRIVRKRKLLIVFSVAVFAAGAAWHTRSLKPVYEAATTVKIEERKSIGGMLSDIMVFSPGDLMESNSRIITGFPVMIETAKRMRFLSANATREEAYRAAEALQGQVRTERVGRTNIIRIIARADDPQQAANLADTVAKAFIEQNRRDRSEQATTSKKFIENQLNAVRKRLYQSEDRLRDFNEKVENIKMSEDVQKKLMELEFELAALLQKYTDKHPKVIYVNEQIRDMEEQVKGFSGQELEYARLKREVEVSRNAFTLLSQKLEEVKIAEAGKIANASIIDPAIVPGRPVNMHSNSNVALGGFLGLVIGLVLSFVVETLDTSMGTIEDVETVMKIPVLGVVPSIGMEDGLTMIEQLKRRFPGARLKKRRPQISLMVHLRPTSPVAESFRNIKTNMRISPERKAFLLTSAGPQEGKTTTLINLGLACAQDGMKVLLVSSDLRRPTICESFGMKKRPGLNEVVLGTLGFGDVLRTSSDMMLGKLGVDMVIKHPGIQNIHVLPAGSLPVNPAEVLDSQDVDLIIAAARQQYDVILFDSPPVLPVTDASILARKVDGVVLCYEIGRTSRHALVRAKAQLEAVDARIQGVILNHIRPETEAVEVYPYYYRYRYYSSNRKEEEVAAKA
jgi:succinoglycan biosynthesis transport protein ExoP